MNGDARTVTDEMALAEQLPQADASSLVDRELLEAEVKDMYRLVASEQEAAHASADEIGLMPALPQRADDRDGECLRHAVVHDTKAGVRTARSLTRSTIIFAAGQVSGTHNHPNGGGPSLVENHSPGTR